MKKILTLLTLSSLITGGIMSHGSPYSEPPGPIDRVPSNRGGPPPPADRPEAPRGAQRLDNTGLNHPGRGADRSQRKEHQPQYPTDLTKDQVKEYAYEDRQRLARDFEKAGQPYMKKEQELLRELGKLEQTEEVRKARESVIEAQRDRLELRKTVGDLRTTGEDDFENIRDDAYEEYTEYVESIREAEEEVNKLALRNSKDRASKVLEDTETEPATVRAIRNYRYEEKQRMLAYVETNVAGLEPRVNTLKGKLANATGEERAQIERSLEVIESRKKELDEAVAEANRNLPESKFEDARTNLANTFSAYAQAINLADAR